MNLANVKICKKIVGIESSKKARDSEHLKGSVDEWVERDGLA
jgi:hypothetical protein